MSKIEGAFQELDETSYLAASETPISSEMEAAKRETEELIFIFVAVVKAAKRGR